MTTSESDKFKIVMDNWRKKYADCFLTDEEEQQYFEKPRKKTQLRHLEDFE